MSKTKRIVLGIVLGFVVNTIDHVLMGRPFSGWGAYFTFLFVLMGILFGLSIYACFLAHPHYLSSRLYLLSLAKGLASGSAIAALVVGFALVSERALVDIVWSTLIFIGISGALTNYFLRKKLETLADNSS